MPGSGMWKMIFTTRQSQSAGKKLDPDFRQGDGEEEQKQGDGKRESENVSGYTTNDMGQRMTHKIGWENAPANY